MTHEQERYKGAVHFAMGGLCAAMALYSGLRLVEERTAPLHLWVNVVIYTAAVGFEGYQTYKHFSAAGA